MRRAVWVALAAAAAIVLILLWKHRSAGTPDKGSERKPAQTLASRRAARYGGGAVDASPASVMGVVRNAQGELVAGAVIEVRGSSLRDLATSQTASGMRFSARSGRDGRFRVAGLSPGTYSVAATARGYTPALLRGITLHAGEERGDLTLTLEGGGYVLSGQVSDIGGGPVAGAAVSVTPAFEGSILDMFFVSYSTVTDENGHYEISLRNGRYGLSAGHPDYSSESASVVIASAPAQQDFELVPGGIIRGRVLSSQSGEPVAGAMVTNAGEASGFVVSGFGDAGAISDASGRFELRGLEPKAYRLTASGPGFRASQPTPVELGIGEEVDGVDILVDRAYTISGFVVRKGQHDEPVPGALIGAYNLRPGAFLLAGKRSESDGYFEIDGVPTGLYNLAAVADDRVPSLTGTHVEVKDDDLRDVLVEIDPGVTIRGRVEPAMPTRISSEIDPKSFSPLTMVSQIGKMLLHGRSDESGTFEIRGAGMGPLRLVARAEDGHTGSIDLQVYDKDLDGVVIRLEQRAFIAGRVVDERGQPVSDVSVTAEPPHRESGGINVQFSMGRGGTPVGPDGSFRIVGLEADHYEVTVEGPLGEVPMADGKMSMEIDVPTDGRDGVVLTIQNRDGSIRGTVTSSVGPVADAFVRVEADWHGKRALTDADGRFEVTGLARGSYSVVATGPKGTGHAGRDDVKVGDDVTLELQAYGSIDARVVGSDLSSCVAELKGPSDRRDRIGKDGAVHFRRLDAGSYRVVASCGDAFGGAEVEVSAGKSASVDIRLAELASLTGLVVDTDGKPMAGVTVLLQPGDPGAALDMGARMLSGDWPQTDANGRFEVTHVRPGKGTLMFTPGTFASVRATKTYEVAPGEREDVGTIELDTSEPADDADAGKQDIGLSLEERLGDDDQKHLYVTEVRPGTLADGKLRVGYEIVAVHAKFTDSRDYEMPLSVIKMILEGEWPDGGGDLSVDVRRDGGEATTVVLVTS